MANALKTLRLFVALELPDDVRQALSELQEDLRRAGAPRLRWVRPDGVHLTLKFLGNVEETRVPSVVGALADAIQPFDLRLRPEGIGAFGGRHPRVVWLGLTGDTAEAAEIAARIERALERERFAREQRRFAPHLTLARVPEETGDTERERLRSLISSYEAPSFPSMTFHRVSLMSSLLGPGGARYECVQTFPQRPLTA